MIDFHAHILPCVDDGSSSVEESVSLLRRLFEQEVDIVCATPHFYASSDSPERFFARRQRAYDELMLAMGEEPLPRVLLGAEVAYFPGIASSRAILDMRLQGSNLLLIEMPMETWSEHALTELVQLSCLPDVTVVLAHVERYISYVSIKTLATLSARGILMQLNASALLKPMARRRALGLIRAGYARILGSDCHNLEHRPPQLDKARNAVAKRFGKEALLHIDAFGASLIRK